MLISGNRHPTAVELYGKDGVRRDPLQYFFIDRYAESYRCELDAFLQALESGAAAPIGVDDDRRALLIAEAGVRSAKSEMPVALPA